MNTTHKIKKVALAICLSISSAASFAQTNGNRISFGVGALYERGFDATVAVEHETKDHNAWEYYLNGYIQYDKDKEARHITTDSFWRSYRTWGLGVAYKPCVYRAKNTYGSLRLGGSVGSDTKEVVGWANVGYEQNYVLRHGWHLYWQVKSDVCINGKDLFRTGIVIGFNLPANSR